MRIKKKETFAYLKPIEWSQEVFRRVLPDKSVQIFRRNNFFQENYHVRKYNIGDLLSDRRKVG